MPTPPLTRLSHAEIVGTTTPRGGPDEPRARGQDRTFLRVDDRGGRQACRRTRPRDVGSGSACPAVVTAQPCITWAQRDGCMSSGALDRVDTISSVSGGSIFAAKLADLAIERNGKTALNRGLRRASPSRYASSRSHDLRTTSMVLARTGRQARPGPARARYGTRGAAQGPARRPEFVFCATDLTYGISWEFSRDDAGSYEFRTQTIRDELADRVCRRCVGVLPAGVRRRFRCARDSR